MQVNVVIEGDCLDVMRAMPDNCIDSIVTDPPYGLQFMGKEWDNLWRNKPGVDKDYQERNGGKLTGRMRDLPDYSSTDQEAMQQWHYGWAKEALRIAKPGATLMAFGGTRTHHRLACAIEDAGWEIRDCINYLNDGTQAEMAFMASLDEEQLAAYLELHYPNYQAAWVYGSGFPKSHNVSKAIDKVAGKEREVVGLKMRPDGNPAIEAMPNGYSGINEGWHRPWMDDPEKVLLHKSITAPATPLAAKFDGYGSALKPAYEIIIIAQKPMGQSYAENAAEWGVAGLNIDGCRIEGEKAGGSGQPPLKFNGQNHRPFHDNAIPRDFDRTTGRYPANIISSAEPGVLAEFAKAGVRTSGRKKIQRQAGIWSKTVVNMLVRWRS